MFPVSCNLVWWHYLPGFLCNIVCLLLCLVYVLSFLRIWWLRGWRWVEVYEFVVVLDLHLCLLGLPLLRASHSDFVFLLWCPGGWVVCCGFFPFSASYYLPLVAIVVVIFILTCGCQLMLTLTIWGVRYGVGNLRHRGMVHWGVNIHSTSLLIWRRVKYQMWDFRIIQHCVALCVGLMMWLVSVCEVSWSGCMPVWWHCCVAIILCWDYTVCIPVVFQ